METELKWVIRETLNRKQLMLTLPGTEGWDFALAEYPDHKSDTAIRRDLGLFFDRLQRLVGRIQD